MDIDKVKENLKNTVFQEYAKSVGTLIRRDYNTIIKIIDDGDLYDILEDNYYIYNDLDDAKQEFDIVTEIKDLSKYSKYSVSKLIKEDVITTYEDDKGKYIFSLSKYIQYINGKTGLMLCRSIPKNEVPFNDENVTIRYFNTHKKGAKEYFPDKGETPAPLPKENEKKKPKKYIYKIDFGDYGVYIGQTQNIKNRMNTHKNTAKNFEHCYVLNMLYKTNKDLFLKALDNVEIIRTFDTYEYFSEVTNAEYDEQINALRNGKKLLGKQCWDDDFRKYLAFNVDEYEYHELLAKSYLINNDPNKNSGYSTYNERTKSNQPRMRYEDVVRYFESLRNQESSSDGSFIM